ncbi:DUF4393 domain-containing protein [Eubacteriales bacterium OttesenSCG-928-A19]|nr:DUF4393 domain-containing protein [Eubacteriales bacterium OttesenSCG-928-A19]
MMDDFQKEVVKGLAKEVYTDAAKPIVGEVGQAAQGILRFVALPFKFLGYTAEQLEEKYKKFIIRAINKVPEENRVEPKGSIVAPILEHVKYVFDKSDLSQMFENLLSSSMNRETNTSVHPSFVERLKCMDSFDARLLNEIHVSKQMDLRHSALTVAIDAGTYKHIKVIETSNCAQVHEDGYHFNKSINLMKSFAIIGNGLANIYDADQYKCYVASTLKMDNGNEYAHVDTFSRLTAFFNECREMPQERIDQESLRRVAGWEFEIDQKTLSTIDNLINAPQHRYMKINIEIKSVRQLYSLTAYGHTFCKCVCPNR